MKRRGSSWVWPSLIVHVACNFDSGQAPEVEAREVSVSVDADAPIARGEGLADERDGAAFGAVEAGVLEDVAAGDAGGVASERAAPAAPTSGESSLDGLSTGSRDVTTPVVVIGGGAAGVVGHDAGSVASNVAVVDASDPAPSQTVWDAPTHVDSGVDSGALPVDSSRGDGAAFDAGPASLSNLEFSGGHTGLHPAFDARRSRYSVIADSDTSLLSVTATANTVVRLNGVELESGVATELPDAAPGSELVFTVGDEPDAARYTVAYLPPNFPELQVNNPVPGATDEPLYLNLASSDGQFIAKLDPAGVPLYYLEASSNIYDFKKHPNGTLSYSVRRSSTKDGAYQVLLNPNFEEISRLSAVGLVNTDVHDFLILPSGNYVFISYEPAVHDLSSFGLSATEKVLDSMFQEVTPDQQVVFQWNSWDHVQYDHSVYAFEQPDYGHANSIAVDHDDNWLLSLRALSQVLKIDRATGQVIWRLGGIASDFTFINDPYSGVCGQHTASRLDNGHILIFDNGRDCLPEIFGSRPKRSRVVEYALDEVNMTAELVWSYERDGFSSTSQGSAQRLANGNTMIGWGHGPTTIGTEVDPDGQVVYDLQGKARNGSKVSCYRCRKFAD